MSNAIKYNMNMSMNDIGSAITSIGSRTSKAKDDAHKVCISLLNRWVKDGDVTAIALMSARMVNETDGYWSQALVNWFTAFCSFEWDAKAKSFTYTKTKFDVEMSKEARETPFFKFTPPSLPQPYILFDKLDTLLSSASKRMKDEKEGDEIPSALINVIRDAVGGWKEGQEVT